MFWVHLRSMHLFCLYLLKSFKRGNSFWKSIAMPGAALQRYIMKTSEVKRVIKSVRAVEKASIQEMRENRF